MKYNDSEYILNCIFGKEIQYRTDFEYRYLKELHDRLEIPVLIDNTKKISAGKANIMYSDKPDLVVVTDDIILGIEHFMIDSSKTTRKGSSYKNIFNNKQLNIIDEQLRDKVKIKDFVTKSYKVSTKLTYENLIYNITSSFENHYQKIESYIDNIRNNIEIGERKILIIFFIHCDVVFPSFIMKDGELKYVSPINDITFIEFLRNKKMLNSVFIHYEGSSSNEELTRFILLEERNIDSIIESEIELFDFSKTEIHDFENPMVTHYIAKIDQKK